MTGHITLEAIAKLVAKSAPNLASIMGSPLAGIGISLLSGYFGLTSDPDKILTELQTDPNAEAKLKQLEYEHAETLQRLQSNDYAIQTSDIQNARQRQITLRDWVPTVLAIGFLLSYASIQFYCVMHNDPNDDVISARFQDILIMIMSYYFGSSHKEKPPT